MSRVTWAILVMGAATLIVPRTYLSGIPGLTELTRLVLLWLVIYSWCSTIADWQRGS